MQTKPISYTSPTLMRIRTGEDKKESYINTSMVVSFEPSEDKNNTDILLVNGKTYTIKGTPAHHVESYRQDVGDGACILNLIR